MNARDHTHDTGQLIEPDIAMLTPSPTNPRKTFDAEALRGLAGSIAEHGIMQPIVVRELSDDTRRQLGTEARLEIIAGERRWRAAQLAGLQTVPCILRNLPDDAVERLQIIENLQREGLSPIEEAEGYGRLSAQGLSADQIAATVGKSKAYIYAKLKLRALCDDVARALHQGKLSESVALQIARIPVPDLQRDALAAVTQPDEYTGEAMSFRRAKAHILQSYTRNIAKAAFDPADTTLYVEAGACQACPHRLGNQADAEPAHANVCTRPPCYDSKTSEHNIRALGADADAARVEIKLSNPKGQATYADYDDAGYRQLNRLNHTDPKNRTYREWLEAYSESVPYHLYVCPSTGNAHLLAKKSDLIAAAERIKAKQVAEEADQRSKIAADPDPQPEQQNNTSPADHFRDARKMVETTAPTDTPPATAAPIISRATNTTTGPATTAPLHGQYLSALRRACRTSPPMLIAWPLTRLIARCIARTVGGHIPDDASEPDCIAAIVSYLTDSAYQAHDAGAALEELAEALNIDHAEIRSFYSGSSEQRTDAPARYRHPENPDLQ